MQENRAIEHLDKGTQRLIRMALGARKRAYAPYSRYRVGCALQDANGKVHTGCNVENASYPVGLCAERTAIAKMVSRGGREFKKIVVVTSSEEPSFPCGMCLQMIQELGKGAIVYAVNRRGSVYRQARVDELFPMAFSKERLRQ